MKVIETEFNGVMFRSRLEARWAIFMTSLNVPYVYEPDGFDLDGIAYLPDFYLPSLDAYLEIKPQKPTNSEFEKARRLAKFTNKVVYILCEQPEPPEQWKTDSMYAIFPDSDDYFYLWCRCEQCGKIGIEFEGRSERLACGCAGDGHKRRTARHPLILEAYKFAKSHRFWTPRHKVSA